MTGKEAGLLIVEMRRSGAVRSSSVVWEDDGCFDFVSFVVFFFALFVGLGRYCYAIGDFPRSTLPHCLEAL